jgi:hypothetical protein
VKARISPLGPGEELIDAEVFHALYSKVAGEAARPAEPRPVPLCAAPTSPFGAARIHTDLSRTVAALAPRAGERRPLARPARPPSAATAAALEAEIDRSMHRAHVARLAVHLARAYVSAAALLRIHRGVIHGVCGEGVAQCGEQLLFPAEGTSPFAEVVASRTPLRGLPPQDGLGARILSVLGRESAQEIAVLPVLIQDRVVGLLYADNGAEALADASFAALQAVCTRLAKAYERLILARKRDLLTGVASPTERQVPVRDGAAARGELAHR